MTSPETDFMTKIGCGQQVSDWGDISVVKPKSNRFNKVTQRSNKAAFLKNNRHKAQERNIFRATWHEKYAEDNPKKTAMKN